jgi:hypothetical protein
MRAIRTGVFLFTAALLPNLGNAQVFLLPTPSPDVSAASAEWQIRSEPIFHAGSFYYPAGPTIYFDGKVMVRTGVYEGIPLYSDSTQEPFSIVYVPIGGNLMRPYERRREGPLAGTVGSRAPSFPIQRDGDLSVASGSARTQTIPPAMRANQPAGTADTSRNVGTGGADSPGAPADPGSQAAPAPPARYEPRPTANDGMWIEYEGARWFSDGPAVSYDADRFVPIGSYRGFPVYREKNGPAETIYVTAVVNGPVAPYSKR